MNSCFLFVFLGLLVTVCYAGPNCNAGLVDGTYYCFENSIWSEAYNRTQSRNSTEWNYRAIGNIRQ